MLSYLYTSKKRGGVTAAPVKPIRKVSELSENLIQQIGELRERATTVEQVCDRTEQVPDCIRPPEATFAGRSGGPAGPQFPFR